MLPYKKKARETRLKSLQNTLKYVVVANNMWKIIYTGKKLASKFNIKDEIGKNLEHDLIHKAQCPDLYCDTTYMGELERRFSQHIIVIISQTCMTRHENVNIDNFQILPIDYKNNKFKRKLAEALHIKHERPTQNVQEQSLLIKLFN